MLFSLYRKKYSNSDHIVPSYAIFEDNSEFIYFQFYDTCIKRQAHPAYLAYAEVWFSNIRSEIDVR